MIDPVDLPTNIEVIDGNREPYKLTLAGIGGDYAAYKGSGLLQVNVPLSNGVKDENALAFIDAVKNLEKAVEGIVKPNSTATPTATEEPALHVQEKHDGAKPVGAMPKVTMEPFGQRFGGIVDTYPELSTAIVEAAAKDCEVYTRNNDVLIDFKGLPGGMGTYQELPPEYAYVLFTRLQRILFGSDPEAKFKAKP